jgi:HAD superfamily hydrolase (TIGR01509 family)
MEMPALRLSVYRAAIFDLDGTLVLSEPAWAVAKRRVLAGLGVEVSQETYDAFVGRGLRGFLTHVLGQDLAVDRRDDLARQIGAEADVLLPQMRQIVPGAAEMIARLAGAGVSVALCSSSPRRHIVAALDQLGVSGLVQIIVSGAELPRGKPDPLPYLETLRLLDLPPDAAFAVEDALPGVHSAHGAGLAVVGIGPDVARPEFQALCRVCVADYDGFGRAFDWGPSTGVDHPRR